MKFLAQKIAITALALLLVAHFTQAIDYQNQLSNLLLVASLLTITQLIVKPILKLLLFPLNILTFGLVNLFLGVVIFYVIAHLTPGFSLHPFSLNLYFTTLIVTGWWIYVVITLILNLVIRFLTWLFS